MSLLDHGRETVLVYHAEKYTSPDGNVMYRISDTPETVTNCSIQPSVQSGTSARRAEQDEEGYQTEEVYRFRPPRWYTTEISPYAQIEWRGKRWHVFGNYKHYNGGDRTAHRDYAIRRT